MIYDIVIICVSMASIFCFAQFLRKCDKMEGWMYGIASLAYGNMARTFDMQEKLEAFQQLVDNLQ